MNGTRKASIGRAFCFGQALWEVDEAALWAQRFGRKDMKERSLMVFDVKKKKESRALISWMR